MCVWIMKLGEFVMDVPMLGSVFRICLLFLYEIDHKFPIVTTYMLVTYKPVPMKEIV